MSSTNPLRLLTAEEFALLPNPDDDSHQELDRGVVVTTPPCDCYHGLCCNEINGRLYSHIRTHNLGHLAINNSGVILERNPDTVRGPDVAFWSRERMPEPVRKGWTDLPPDLVVEVLSPSDVFTTVQRKVQHYLRAGVKLVWVAVPEDRSVAVCRMGREQILLSNGETLGGEDVLPGFTCLVGELLP
jgi:Uma2 family endonuclease